MAEQILGPDDVGHQTAQGVGTGECPVLDWHTKKIVGHYAGLQAKAPHWLLTLDTAVQR